MVGGRGRHVRALRRPSRDEEHDEAHHQSDRAGLPASLDAHPDGRDQTVADMRAKVPSITGGAGPPPAGGTSHRLQRRVGPRHHDRRPGMLWIHGAGIGDERPLKRRTATAGGHRSVSGAAVAAELGAILLRQRRRLCGHNQTRGARPHRQPIWWPGLSGLQRRGSPPDRSVYGRELSVGDQATRGGAEHQNTGVRYDGRRRCARSRRRRRPRRRRTQPCR